MNRKLIIGVSGASGIRYTLRLLQQIPLLRGKYSEIHLIYTEAAKLVAKYEEDIDDLESFLAHYELDSINSEKDWVSPLASSSRLINSDMVVIPASMNTIAKISSGIQDNLLLRAATSIIRLRGKLVLVVRETPLSSIDLENLFRLSKNGAIVLPASPGFYGKPSSINDLVDFIIGKVLDVLGVENELYKRWSIRSDD